MATYSQTFGDSIPRVTQQPGTNVPWLKKPQKNTTRHARPGVVSFPGYGIKAQHMAAANVHRDSELLFSENNQYQKCLYLETSTPARGRPAPHLEPKSEPDFTMLCDMRALARVEGGLS